MDLTEAEDIKKRWQEYTEELYNKKDNHDGDTTAPRIQVSASAHYSSPSFLDSLQVDAACQVILIENTLGGRPTYSRQELGLSHAC